MKKENFKPIAMKCNKKQFKSIKGKLKEIGEIGILSNAFKKYNYLTNNYGPKNNFFDFIGNCRIWENQHKNNIHETWNEKIFLEACGVEVEEPKEESFVITKEQVLEIHSFAKVGGKADAKLREMFPCVFVKKMTKAEIETELGYNIEIV